MCGDCGGFYGQKVWHSNDPYRRVVWRCNCKYKRKCHTPTLDSETIQQLFLKAYNALMEDREGLIADCEEMCMVVGDCGELEKEIEELNDEIRVVAELVNECVKDNATKKKSQGAYTEKYNGLVARYEKAVEKLRNKTEERNSKIERARTMRLFISALKKQPLVVKEWDEALWMSLIETVTVYKNERVKFLFKNGYESVIFTNYFCI